MNLKQYPKLFLLFLFLITTACEDDDAQLLSVAGGDPETAVPVVVDEWTDLLPEAERHTFGLRPNGSARALAYIYLAAYETMMPAAEGYRSAAAGLPGLDVDPDYLDQGFVDTELALNACFARVLPHFLSNCPPEYTDRFAAKREELIERLGAAQTDQTVITSGLWGRYVARRIIAYSQTDEEEAEQQLRDPQPYDYEPPAGAGFWTFSADPERALFPYWERARTFAVAVDETTTVPPLTYSDAPGTPYYEQMMEVYTVNNEAREADDEQLWIAEFWSDDVEGLMMSPPARQIAIANQLKDQYDLSLAETPELFVRVGFALNDAAVATWKYKYEHMVMRPTPYIKAVIDPDYTTNLYRFIYWPDPSFPGYLFGHSAFASAAGGVFAYTFGDTTDFTDRTHESRTEFRGTPRTFNSFAQLAEENAFSRLPLGVHMRMDCAEGLRLGYEIAEGVNGLVLR